MREARARGIGTSGTTEEMVKSLVRVFSKRKRDKDAEDDEDEDAEDSPPPSKRLRSMDKASMGDRLLAGHDNQRPGMSPNPKMGDSLDSSSDSFDGLSSLSSELDTPQA